MIKKLQKFILNIYFTIWFRIIKAIQCHFSGGHMFIKIGGDDHNSLHECKYCFENVMFIDKGKLK